MENKYFNDVKNVKMSELINWFMSEFPEMVDDMHNSNHAVNTNEPNPYHIEGSVLNHVMLVCQRAENDNIVVKLIALLHDVSKNLGQIQIDRYDSDVIDKLSDEKLKDKFKEEYQEWLLKYH